MSYSPCCAVAVAALSEMSEPPPSDTFPPIASHPVLKNCREIGHLGLYYVIEVLKLGSGLKPRRNVYLGVTTSHLVMVTMMGALSRALKLDEITKIIIDKDAAQILIVPAQVSGDRSWGLQLVTCGYAGTRLLSAICHVRRPHTSGKGLAMSWRPIKSSEQSGMKKNRSQQKTLQHRVRELRLYGPDHVAHYERVANEYAEALRTDLENIEENNIMAAELAARRLESQLLAVVIAAVPAALEGFFMAHVAILSKDVHKMKIQDDLLIQEIEKIKQVHEAVRKQHSVSVAVLSSQIPSISGSKMRPYKNASPEHKIDPYQAPSLSPVFDEAEEVVKPTFDRSFLMKSSHSSSPGVRSRPVHSESADATFMLKSPAWDTTDVETANTVAFNLSRAGVQIKSYAWRLDGSLSILLKPTSPLPVAVNAACSLGYSCYTLEGCSLEIDEF